MYEISDYANLVAYDVLLFCLVGDRNRPFYSCGLSTLAFSLRSRRLEVVGTRKNGSAKGRQERGEGAPARRIHENSFNLHSVSAVISNWSRGSRGKK